MMLEFGSHGVSKRDILRDQLSLEFTGRIPKTLL